MTPEQLVDVILAGVGVIIQLAIMYIPKFNEWYDNLPNKGLFTLGVDVGFGAAYFALGCVPVLASMLGILLTCDLAGAFVLFKAIFLIAVAQQTAYSFLKANVKRNRLMRG